MLCPFVVVVAAVVGLLLDFFISFYFYLCVCVRACVCACVRACVCVCVSVCVCLCVWM